MRPRDVSRLSPAESEMQSAILEPINIDRVRSMRLKQTIEGFWRERGYFVDVRIGVDGEITSDLVLTALPEVTA